MAGIASPHRRNPVTQSNLNVTDRQPHVVILHVVIRILTYTLLSLYLVLSSGIQVRAHWCGGKLSSVDWFSGPGHKPCGCSHGEDLSGCCRELNYKLSASSHKGRETQVSQAQTQAKAVIRKPSTQRPVFFPVLHLLQQKNQPFAARSYDGSGDRPVYRQSRRIRT